MPVLISVIRIAAANLCRKQQNDYLVERLKRPNKRKSKTSFKVLPSKSKKHSYLERVGTKADMMKQYDKAGILLSQIIQISNQKYKTLLVNNEEDNITESIIRNIKNDVDKSPRIFLQIKNNKELQHDTINLCQSILKNKVIWLVLKILD